MLVAPRNEEVSEHLSNSCRVIFPDALGCCFVERCLFPLQVVQLLRRKGCLCRAGALWQEGWVGRLAGTPGSAARWGLPFKREVRNGELRALPKRHLPGRSELSDGSEPRVSHHVPHRCVLPVTPRDRLLGKTTGNRTTRHPAPLCADKAHGSSERRWPWDPPATETSSTPRFLPAEGASLGHRCMPQALLPAEVENVLFQLPNFFLYLFVKENLFLAFLLHPSLSL